MKYTIDFIRIRGGGNALFSLFSRSPHTITITHYNFTSHKHLVYVYLTFCKFIINHGQPPHQQWRRHRNIDRSMHPTSMLPNSVFSSFRPFLAAKTFKPWSDSSHGYVEWMTLFQDVSLITTSMWPLKKTESLFVFVSDGNFTIKELDTPSNRLCQIKLNRGFSLLEGKIGAWWIIYAMTREFTVFPTVQNSYKHQTHLRQKVYISLTCSTRFMLQRILENNCRRRLQSLHDLLQNHSLNASMPNILVDIRSWTNRFTHIDFMVVPRECNKMQILWLN